jgi:O-methyltransferase
MSSRARIAAPLVKVKAAIRNRVSPRALAYYYTLAQLPSDPDVTRLTAFLRHRHPQLSLWRRLSLVERLLRISWAVDCAHTQTEILAFIEAILALPSGLPGCVVEAGCYKGGSTAKVSIAAHLSGRDLVVFDSFEGIPENAEPHERNIFGGPASFPKGIFRGRLEEVEGNVRRFGRVQRCEFVKGWFDDTLPGFSRPIAAIYVDVDLVSSTRTCLKYLYPQLAPGGVLFSHDGHLPLVVQLYDDDDFWRNEIGCPKPAVEGLGTSKLLKIVKPADRG